MTLKTVITLGPASQRDAVITKLLESSDRFRLNASHLNPQSIQTWLKKIDKLSSRVNKIIPVVIDLQGAKLRIGSYPETEKLPSVVNIVLNEKSETTDTIPVNNKKFFLLTNPGEILSLNDAKITLKVISTTDSSIKAEVLKNGPLSSKKGINISKHPMPYDNISDSDKEIIESVKKYSFVQFAFSFVHTGTEAALLRKFTDKHIIAKIEHPEAMDHLDKIDKNFNEIWLCRGDLGAQAGIENLGKLQEDFVKKIPIFKNPVFIAGQVLEHMTYFEQPTRSEVVHLYNIKQTGFTGIVLSDETAIGKHPLLAAEILNKLC